MQKTNQEKKRMENKEINLFMTIVFSFPAFLLGTIIMGGGLVFCINNIKSNSSISSICFWGTMAIIIIREFGTLIPMTNIIVYKNKENRK